MAETTGKFSTRELDSFVEQFHRDSFCILPAHFATSLLESWAKAFNPLLLAHIEREGHMKNRGANRYYVTLPFQGLFADPQIYEDSDILAICKKLVGDDMTMCQLATDTPLMGSEYQEIHRDSPGLFPEFGIETPPYQIAVNFPLCDVTLENGPFEVVRGTHAMLKKEAFALLDSGERKIEPITMKLGDVMIRDVRALHRGTPNKTHSPRPMCVIGYSRKWLLRPEVGINIPRAEYEKLSPQGKQLLRFENVVESLIDAPTTEAYQSFAY